MSIQRKFRILLFIGTEHGVGRSVTDGIFKYANIHGPWEFYTRLPFYAAPRTKKKFLDDIKEWQPDGTFIMKHEKSDPIEELLKLNLPSIVSLPTISPTPSYPGIISNNHAIGSMGADHLIELGFRNYAFFGCKKMIWSEERLASFSEKVTKAGHNFEYHEFGSALTQHSWEGEHESLKKWLWGVKKPLGLMACNDDFARIILATCQSIGILVPEHIAILGVDNEKQVCNVCMPQLSSVVINFEHSGYRAAELMNSLLKGKDWNGQNIIAVPTHIEVRGSTDIISIEDEYVVAAVRFIRENTTIPIQVQDVADAACLSRRALEIRFKRIIGHSIYNQIRRVRVNEIAKILLETNLPLSTIMLKRGYNDKHIARWFKLVKGMTPSEYREKFTH